MATPAAAWVAGPPCSSRFGTSGGSCAVCAATVACAPAAPAAAGAAAGVCSPRLQPRRSVGCSRCCTAGCQSCRGFRSSRRRAGAAILSVAASCAGLGAACGGIGTCQQRSSGATSAVAPGKQDALLGIGFHVSVESDAKGPFPVSGSSTVCLSPSLVLTLAGRGIGSCSVSHGSSRAVGCGNNSAPLQPAPLAAAAPPTVSNARWCTEAGSSSGRGTAARSCPAATMAAAACN